MMARAWELIQKVGGVLLVILIVIFVMGSAHQGRPLHNSREFGQAFDEVTGSIVRELTHGTQWIAGH
jgi:hypothetical protein